MGVIGGGKKERPSLLPRRQQGLSGWALTGQASPDALPQSQAILQPALTWRPTACGGAEACGQHAGQGWNVSLLWLAGDSGPPGSGVHEGMDGVTTLA